MISEELSRPRVVIVAARRTPFGRFRGGLSALSPVELACIAGEAVLTDLDRTTVDQVFLGNVLSAGHGMNIARQVAVTLGLPLTTAATTINLMCGSGMQAALMGAMAIRLGEANAVLVGGTESMSQSALLLPRPPKGQSPTMVHLTDSMQHDGLIDSLSQQHMGDQAERLAADFGISRKQQDAFALRSQQLYQSAAARAVFHDELTPAGSLTADQHPRSDLTAADLAALKPAFQPDGTVTAANASGVNDGAALLLLADSDFAKQQHWPVLAELAAGTVVGCAPDRMGLGPVGAIHAVLHRTNTSWSDIDTLEINEAFATQTLACLQKLSLELLESNDTTAAAHVHTADGHEIAFNSEGGAIALGHPLAASGARLLVHLACKIHRGESQLAVASLCIGGGMGIAALLKRCE